MRRRVSVSLRQRNDTTDRSARAVSVSVGKHSDTTDTTDRRSYSRPLGRGARVMTMSKTVRVVWAGRRERG